MCGPFVILSDTHLGRPHGSAVSAQALRPLWDGADRLILNGDVAEVHHPSHWSQAARQTLHLFDLCEADDVELTLLSGNHDPYISDVRHLHLANGRVFVTHGDVLHPAVAPWSPASARMRRTRERALAQLDPESRANLQSRLTASQHASYEEWRDLDRLREEAAHSSLKAMLIRPWSLAQVIAYWRIFPRLASAFLKDHAPQARFAVVGHTHRPGIRRIDGRVIINTGAFGWPGRPCGVVIDDGVLRFQPIDLVRGEYRFVSRGSAQFDLSTAEKIASRARAPRTAAGRSSPALPVLPPAREPSPRPSPLSS